MCFVLVVAMEGKRRSLSLGDLGRHAQSRDRMVKDGRSTADVSALYSQIDNSIRHPMRRPDLSSIPSSLPRRSQVLQDDASIARQLNPLRWLSANPSSSSQSDHHPQTSPGASRRQYGSKEVILRLHQHRQPVKMLLDQKDQRQSCL
jgi:hypothetical protein